MLRAWNYGADQVGTNRVRRALHRIVERPVSGLEAEDEASGYAVTVTSSQSEMQQHLRAPAPTRGHQRPACGVHQKRDVGSATGMGRRVRINHVGWVTGLVRPPEGPAR